MLDCDVLKGNSLPLSASQSNVACDNIPRQSQRPAALLHKQPSGIFRAIHYFHTEGGATFTRRSSEAPLYLLFFQTNNQNHNNITHLLSSYTMAFRCESDDSDNELTAMQEEIIQPYQLALAFGLLDHLLK